MVLPELVAHRGYALRYPENTLIAVAAAIRAGARFIEVDVQLTRDEVPVLFHDRDLQRVCQTAGAIADFTLARVKTLRAGEFARFGYRFPDVAIATLAELVEFLRQHPQVTVFIELKSEGIARFTAATVLRRVGAEVAALGDRCVLISYSLEILALARSEDYRRLGVVVRKWRERRSRAVRALGPEFLFCDKDNLPRWGSLRAHATKLVVFEVTDPIVALRLAHRGVAFIETFAVGELKQQMELLAAAHDVG